MKSIGFKLKDESKAIKIIRLIFYIVTGIYFVYTAFFSFGLYITLPGPLQVYTVPMLIFSGLILLSIIFVRVRLYTASAILMTVSTVGTVCVGFMLRNPTYLEPGMTFDAISKEMLILNFLPVFIPFILMFVLLIPALSARRQQRLNEEQTYVPQFK